MGSILLVESDPETGDQWSTALSAAGHTVHVASASRDALTLMREGGIELVVIDSPDPRAGVIELARAIEALPEAPPMVLVSGSPHAPEISARIGVATFVAKPCEPSEVVAVVNKLMNPSRPGRTFEDEPTGPKRQYG